MLLNFYVFLSVCPREITLDQHFIWFASIDNSIKSEFLFNWQSWQMRSLCAILSHHLSPIQNQNANDEELRMMVHIQMMMHTTNLKERLERNIWRMYDKNVTNFCLVCDAIPTQIVNGISHVFENDQKCLTWIFAPKIKHLQCVSSSIWKKKKKD